MRLIIDTDVFVDLLREHPPAVAWANSLSKLPFLSGIAALEVSFGARSILEKREVFDAIDRFDVLWPTDEDIRKATFDFTNLKLSHGIGSLDCICAALSLRYGLPLATFNSKHFRAVPGLSLVQPYTR